MEYCALCQHAETDHKTYGKERHCIGLIKDSKPEQSAAYPPASDFCTCKGFVSAPLLEQLTQQECAKRVADNAPDYPAKLAERARKYCDALTACGSQSLGLPSPEVNKALAAGAEFWTEFKAYQQSSKIY
jgi:hypothetical protein